MPQNSRVIQPVCLTPKAVKQILELLDNPISIRKISRVNEYEFRIIENRLQYFVISEEFIVFTYRAFEHTTQLINIAIPIDGIYRLEWN